MKAASDHGHVRSLLAAIRPVGLLSDGPNFCFGFDCRLVATKRAHLHPAQDISPSQRPG